jgi:hypothetical protein
MDQVFDTVQLLPAAAVVTPSSSFQSLCLTLFYRRGPLVLIDFAALHSFLLFIAIVTEDGRYDRYPDREKRS